MSQSEADRVISTPYSEPAEHGVSCGASTDTNEAYDRAKRHEAAIVDAKRVGSMGEEYLAKPVIKAVCA